MHPRRRVPTRLHPSSSVEPEQQATGQDWQDEVRELRAEVAEMRESARRQEETARRQEETMARMMRMLEQRSQPVVAPSSSPPAPSSPVVVPPPAPVAPTVPTAPVTSRQTSQPEGELTPEEERYLVDLLTRFRHFDPPRFAGRSLEPWEADSWIAAMERQFENMFIKERHKVYLATYFLDGDAETWWRRVRPVGPSGAQQLSWSEFRSLLLGTFFPDSVRQRLEEELRNLQQGTRSVLEYIREFTRLLNCVPQTARDELQRVYMFERGLCQDIFQFVRSQRLQTLDASMEQALYVERGAAVMIERTLAPAVISGAKRPVPEDDGQSSRQGPPRPPRYHPQGRGPQGRQRSGGSRPQQRHQHQQPHQQQQPQQQRRQDRCVICGGPHPPSACSQRQGRCYRCGQAGHFQAACPRVVLTVLPLATAPPLPLQGAGASPVYRQADSAMPSQQTEWQPPAPSG